MSAYSRPCRSSAEAQRLLGDLPLLVGADRLLRPGRQLDADVLEPERRVELVDRLADVDDLALDLIGHAEDVGVVLGEGADAEQPVQDALALVAGDVAVLGQPQRQVAVGVPGGVEDEAGAGAVHRLQGEPPVALLAILVGGLGEVHVLPVVLVVPGAVPEVDVHHLRRADLDVASGSELLRLLQATGLPVHPVPVGDAVRANVSVVETDGTVTKLNEPGPSLTATEIESLVATALKLSRPGGWLVASGSLPVGAPTDTYASIAERASAAGVRFALDSSGAALAVAIAAGPSLIKPNLEELRELTGDALPTLGDVTLAIKRLLARGRGTGPSQPRPARRGAVGRRQLLHGMAVVDEVRNTVGAGDALLAGTLAGGNDPPGPWRPVLPGRATRSAPREPRPRHQTPPTWPQ